jgi:hypothetical protein
MRQWERDAEDAKEQPAFKQVAVVAPRANSERLHKQPAFKQVAVVAPRAHRQRLQPG